MALVLAGSVLGAPTPRGASRTQPPMSPGAISASSSFCERAASSHLVTDFTSDVGRKKFGFSHEEVDDANAYYEGQFRLYQRSGEGTLHNPDIGLSYVGQWQFDRYHGDGENTWPDGSRYVGQWRNGQKHGKGKYTSSEALCYSGQWEEGRRHGLGTQEYANGDRYEGGWWNGLCSGIGTYSFADGSKYEGAWANGHYHGSGVLFSSDGGRERRWYSSGLLMKREVLTGSSSPCRQTRRDLVGGKVAFGHARDDMHRPALLAKLHPSKYLIQRETGGVDLSAAPLRPLAPTPSSSEDSYYLAPRRRPSP